MGRLESGSKKREMRTGKSKVEGILLSVLGRQLTINIILCFTYPNNNNKIIKINQDTGKNPKWKAKNNKWNYFKYKDTEESERKDK